MPVRIRVKEALIYFPMEASVSIVVTPPVPDDHIRNYRWAATLLRITDARQLLVHIPFHFPQAAVRALDAITEEIHNPERDRGKDVVIDLRPIIFDDTSWMLLNGYRAVPNQRPVIRGGRQIELEDDPAGPVELPPYPSVWDVLQFDMPGYLTSDHFYDTHHELLPRRDVCNEMENQHWRTTWKMREETINRLVKTRSGRHYADPMVQAVLQRLGWSQAVEPSPLFPEVTAAQPAPPQSRPSILSRLVQTAGPGATFLYQVVIQARDGARSVLPIRRSLSEAREQAERAFARHVRDPNSDVSLDDYQNVRIRVFREIEDEDGEDVLGGFVAEQYGSMRYVRPNEDELYYVLWDAQSREQPGTYNSLMDAYLAAYEASDPADHYSVIARSRVRQGNSGGVQVGNLIHVSNIIGLVGNVADSQRWPEPEEPEEDRAEIQPAPIPAISLVPGGPSSRTTQIQVRDLPHYVGPPDATNVYPRWALRYAGNRVVLQSDQSRSIWFSSVEGAIRYGEELIAMAASEQLTLDPSNLYVRQFNSPNTHYEPTDLPIPFTGFVRHPSAVTFVVILGDTNELLPTFTEALMFIRDHAAPGRHTIEQWIRRDQGANVQFSTSEVLKGEDGNVRWLDASPEVYPRPFVRPANAVGYLDDPANWMQFRRILPLADGLPLVDMNGQLFGFEGISSAVRYLETLHALLVTENGAMPTLAFSCFVEPGRPRQVIALRTLPGFTRHPHAIGYTVLESEDQGRTWQNAHPTAERDFDTFHAALARICVLHEEMRNERRSNPAPVTHYAIDERGYNGSQRWLRRYRLRRSAAGGFIRAEQIDDTPQEPIQD